MKAIQQHLSLILLALVSAIISTSCINDDNSNDITYSNLVTYTGNIGTNAYFEYQGENDAKPVTLYTNRILSGISEGQRMVIMYSLENENQYGKDGYIQLLTYSSVPTVAVRTATTSEAQAANEPMYLYAIARTGKYINIDANLPLIEGRTFSILADEATLHSEMPELYVTTKTPSGNTGLNESTLASFDISSIWNMADIRGVKIHVNDINPSGKKVYEFTK